MNAQTLNRMIKASYYAPNGAQLRKACYGLNSRRASGNPTVALEQIEQLPKEEQVKVKTEIATELLIEGSKRTQAKLNNQGLKDIKVYILENGMSPEEMIKESQKADPLLVRSMESKIHNVEDAIKLTGKVAKARSFQDIFSFLDVPTNWIQEKTENFPYFKLAVFTAGLNLFFEVLQAGADLGIEDGGVYFLATVIVMLGFSGLVYAYQYFFGNIDTWIRKRIGRVKAWVVLIPFRVMSLALKTFGWILDNVIGGIKGAWNSFFSKQAKIAMQYPEFRSAYYNI